MAILKFRVYWEEDDAIYRDVLVKHTQSFLSLHEIILKSFEFDNCMLQLFTGAMIFGKEEEKLAKKYTKRNT
jgi:hypothetical protein